MNSLASFFPLSLYFYICFFFLFFLLPYYINLLASHCTEKYIAKIRRPYSWLAGCLTSCLQHKHVVVVLFGFFFFYILMSFLVCAFLVVCTLVEEKQHISKSEIREKQET